MEATFTSTPRIEQALVLAMSAHANQLRWGSGLPYVTHPFGVALSLVVYGDEDLVIAGLGHDLVEDTEVTLKQLRRMFGDDVAVMVGAVSKDPDHPLPYFDWIGQMIAYAISLGPVMALRIIRLKRADVCHNLSTLGPDNESMIVRYTQAKAMLDVAEAAVLASTGLVPA